MRTRWVVAAFVDLVGLTLVARGQQGAVELAEETRTAGIEPNKIPVAADQQKPALKFGGYGSSESLDPGQKNDQTLDVAHPARSAAGAKSRLRHIRVLAMYGLIAR